MYQRLLTIYVIVLKLIHSYYIPTKKKKKNIDVTI